MDDDDASRALSDSRCGERVGCGDPRTDEAIRGQRCCQRCRASGSPGCAFGYLGPNGAGKTTLIRVLLGLTRADAGTMSVLGHPLPRDRAKALARVGAIVDEPRFHAHLTGKQNLQLLAAAREPAAGAHRAVVGAGRDRAPC